MSATDLTQADFAALPRQHSADQLSRPSLSYWADAWRRLRANPRAMSSLGLILALLAFVTVGPMVWTVDPSVQDVDQIGISPGADRQVTLTTPFIPWEPEALTPPTPSTGNPLGFTLAQSATTQSVRLTWADQDSPRRLYRN
jgi:oligopeptide transport system permease protein